MPLNRAPSLAAFTGAPLSELFSTRLHRDLLNSVSAENPK